MPEVVAQKPLPAGIGAPRHLAAATVGRVVCLPFATTRRRDRRRRRELVAWMVYLGVSNGDRLLTWAYAIADDQAGWAPPLVRQS
jgi:hypothetical protein